jgi:hypothetical protein
MYLEQKQILLEYKSSVLTNPHLLHVLTNNLLPVVHFCHKLRMPQARGLDQSPLLQAVRIILKWCKIQTLFDKFISA